MFLQKDMLTEMEGIPEFLGLDLGMEMLRRRQLLNLLIETYQLKDMPIKKELKNRENKVNKKHLRKKSQMMKLK